jgi:glutamate-1-semialdehyde 2,1-aminomutase
MMDKEKLLESAGKYLVGSCLGMFHLPQEINIVISHGKGSKIYDSSGREYIDYIMGSGPLILGHAHPSIVEAVQKQAALGSTFYTLNEPVIELAEMIVKAVPCADTVRFTSSGTEATYYALRLARAYTGREKILKFEGGWHGVHDYALQSSLSEKPSDYPHPQPDSMGIPSAVTNTVLVAPFNNIEMASKIIEENRNELAAVILEPLQRVIKPIPGFIEELRKITEDYGIILIFDEIVTGFRLAWGGAQEKYGVVPDLATYGKTIAGGYPMAAICGKKRLMDCSDPHRRNEPDSVIISGTLSGNPVGASAGLATLNELNKPGTYSKLYHLADILRKGVKEIANSLSIPVQIPGEGPVLSIYFTDQEIIDYSSTLKVDRERGYQLGVNLIKRGIFTVPGGKIYLSSAHTDEDIDNTLKIIQETIKY